MRIEILSEAEDNLVVGAQFFQRRRGWSRRVLFDLALFRYGPVAPACREQRLKILVLRARSNRLADTIPLTSKILQILSHTENGTVTVVE